MAWNELLKRRDLHPRGSDKWRELDRASLIEQSSNQIKSVSKQLSKMPQWSGKNEFQKQDYARTRITNYLSDLEKKQKEDWRKRDIRRVRDSIKSSFGD